MWQFFPSRISMSTKVVLRPVAAGFVSISMSNLIVWFYGRSLHVLSGSFFSPFYIFVQFGIVGYYVKNLPFSEAYSVNNHLDLVRSQLDHQTRAHLSIPFWNSLSSSSCLISAINGSGPAYLSELRHVYIPSRTLRSSSDTRMLKIKQYKCKTHGFRIFCCFGPRIRNSLPQDLRHCSTLSSFKAKLKTFLFLQYFRLN